MHSRIRLRLCSALAFAVVLLAADSQTLVTVDWLALHRGEPKLVILDSRPEADYARGHLPGAVSVNTSDYLVDSSPQGERAFQQWLVETFSRAGIGSDDQVVVYDAKLGPRAGRAYWFLCYAGQPTVKMLEGGFEAWRQKQLPVETGAGPQHAATRYRLRPQKKWMSSAQEVAASMKDRKTIILDVRSGAEYDGKGNAAGASRQGHVPGAVRVEWTEFLTPDGLSFAAPEKLGVLLTEKGITADKQIVVYCQSGARASVAWAALDDLGYPKVKNYIGSWHDWADKKELPVE